MVSVRRRSPTSSPVEHLEKGSVKNQPSRLCLLVSLSAFFWLLLVCLSFFVRGDRSVLEFKQFIPVSVNSESISTRQVNAQLSDTQPLAALIRPFIEPKNTQNLTVVESEKSPVVVPKKAGKTPDIEPDMTPVVEPKRVKSSRDIKFEKSPVVPKKVDKEPDIKSEKSPVVEPIVLEKSPDFEPKKAEPLPLNQSKNSTCENLKDFSFMKALKTIENKGDSCGGRYIYMHNLPPRFNEDMVKECKSLNPWANMCKFTTNAGLGPPLENIEGVFSDTGWYATDQFALDVIFTNRMKQYECLTNDSSLAAAIFVPFYAGFDIARYLWGFNTSIRDAASLDLVDWLEKRPEWQIMGGKDHFLVSGRISWDFRRLSDENSDWGNKLLRLPAAKNMSMLVVESSPWNANDFGIPYPTYFHPAKDADVFDWQERMRNLDRKWLFSFAGAPRPDDPKSIRGHIINECRNSKVCKLLECDLGESKCHSPSSIMKMFQSSLFCLQPQGDSYTRRSSFDSILAGCIPVFFHPGSAYTQYTWHLPKAYSNYSVLIPENDVRKRKVSIEQTLSKISPEQVKIMREKVISLIPRLIYADPRSKLETLKDAFDVSVQAIINKVTKLRRDIVDGCTNDDFIEELSWKYSLLDEGQSVGPHEWDPFFSKSKNEND